MLFHGCHFFHFVHRHITISERKWTMQMRKLWFSNRSLLLYQFPIALGKMSSFWRSYLFVPQQFKGAMVDRIFEQSFGDLGTRRRQNSKPESVDSGIGGRDVFSVHDVIFWQICWLWSRLRRKGFLLNKLSGNAHIPTFNTWAIKALTLLLVPLDICSKQLLQTC